MPGPIPQPSPWVARFADRIPKGGRVLDVACGRGRHTRFLVARGHPVTAVDVDPDAVDDVRSDRVEAVQADLEGGPWPFPGRRFAAVVVTNYLWRPLVPFLCAAVDAGGLLLYETFGVGNEQHGRPRSPEFLLQPGELLDWARDHGLQVVAYECGETLEPDPSGQGVIRVRQRICAARGDRPLRL